MYCPDGVMFFTLFTADRQSGQSVTQAHGFLFFLLQVRGEVSRCCPLCISLCHNLHQSVILDMHRILVVLESIVLL